MLLRAHHDEWVVVQLVELLVDLVGQVRVRVRDRVRVRVRLLVDLVGQVRVRVRVRVGWLELAG